MKIEARLKELGITLPPVPAAAGNYVHAVQTGNTVYLAGKGPLAEPGKPRPSGKVPKDVSVEDAYKQRFERFYNLPKRFTTSTILLRTDLVGADKDKVALKLEALRAEAAGGADFATLARTLSKDTGSAEGGGDLGFSDRNAFVKPFADALAKLKKGQMTDAPVQTNFGWHVIQVQDERALKVPTFDEAKGNLQRGMQQQTLQKAVADLRAKAKIE